MRLVHQTFLDSTFPASTFQAGLWEVVEAGDRNVALSSGEGLEVGAEDGENGHSIFRRIEGFEVISR